MTRIVVFVVTLVVGATPGWAHRLNVFAYLEGERVFVEARFKGGTPAQDSDVRVEDGAGATLVSGRTDREGKFDFAVPARGELVVIVDAGEGHRGQWKLSAAELGGTSSSAASPPPPPSSPTAAAAPTLDATQLEAALERVLERKLAPMRQMLIEQQMREPGWREALGGLGWVVAAVAAGMALLARRKYRRP
ncbi:hypothetical protein HS125_18420 [bacterium]|nr:hypothetical protein [bacterium]